MKEIIAHQILRTGFPKELLARFPLESRQYTKKATMRKVYIKLNFSRKKYNKQSQFFGR